MPDLHWTIPVARWSSWPAAATAAPDIGFIEPIVRRRLSTLSRIALKVAHDCVGGGRRGDASGVNQGDTSGSTASDLHVDRVRVVFASRHGELRRTTDILRAITVGEPVSPTAFSLSVLNAMTGVFGIARGDRSAASAIAAGAETLGYALLEAHAQYATQPASSVLLVYADEPADAAYGTIEDEVQGGALAILLDDAHAQGQLTCTLTSVGTAGNDADAGAHRVSTNANENVSKSVSENESANTAAKASANTNTNATPNQPAAARFATQSEALQACLERHVTTAWQGAGLGPQWQWSWHDRAV